MDYQRGARRNAKVEIECGGGTRRNGEDDNGF